MNFVYVPVWRPLRPSIYGNRVFAFSPKLKRLIEVSSRLENERWMLIEWDQEVETFATEPVIAEAYVDGRMRKSRIDFWVRWKNGHERFEEVKYAQELVDVRSRAHRQIAIQRNWCAARNAEHAVVTDQEIWANPTLLNSLRTLFSEYNVSNSHELGGESRLCEEIKAAIKSRPGREIHAVIHDFNQSVPVDIARLSLFELIRLGKVNAKIEEERLSPRSKIYPRGEL